MKIKKLRFESSVLLVVFTAISTMLCAVSSARADMVVIVSRPKCNWLDMKDVGHVAIGFYDSNERLVETKGMWPVTKEFPDNVRSSYSEDRALVLGNSGACRGVYTRVANVSRQRREWLQNSVATAAGTNCRYYLFIGKVGGDTSCSCVNFATRVWRQTTGNQERWQGLLQPASVGERIYAANGKQRSGVFDGGKTWSHLPLNLTVPITY
jgi:hypothetical protein